MRLLFLCACLEPGRDGVGDYARRLAEECVALGHTCALLALNDPYVTTPAEDIEVPGDSGQLVAVDLRATDAPAKALPPAVRRPEVDGYPERHISTFRLPPHADPAPAIAFREKFAPDWISLQLVAYGLHPKGLLFSVIPRLRALIGATPLHLMLHELWLGNDAVPTLRHRLTGALQKASLRRLLAALKPALVATTNPVYAALLKTIGVNAVIQPLFGNVPVLPDAPLPEEVADRLRPCSDWVGLFFGGLYREWQPQPFFGRLERIARAAGRSVALVQLGRAGEVGDAIWSRLERDYASTFTFVRLGPQPAPVVSAVMQRCDFGIAASPWSLFGKSGSAATMLDHGLPVIVTRDDFRPHVVAAESPTSDPFVIRDGPDLEAKLAAGFPTRAPRSRAPEAAVAWVRQLEAEAHR